MTEPRPRTPLDRLIERHLRTAPIALLERYARLLSPKQTFDRCPDWTFDIPVRRDDLGTFARRLIWERYRDQLIDRPVQVRWCGRLKLKLRLANDVGWEVFVGGAYEPNELAFVAGALEPGVTVLDIGANEGLFTLVAADRVGPAGRVLAVEPSAREFDCLQANIALNQLHNVEPVRLALYDHDGSGQLTRAGFGHEGQNTIGDRIPNPGVTAAGTETVPLDTLDALAEAHDLDRLDLVKVDAEGCEARILAGGLATVRHFQPILLLEVAPDHLAAQGSTIDDLLDLLGELEYRVWMFDRDGRLRVRADEPIGLGNIAAAPASVVLRR